MLKFSKEMDKNYNKPFGDILKQDLPLDEFGAKNFNLTERLDFSGHNSGKVTPHLNSEITFDNNKIGKKYNDLTKTQLPGFNNYQYEGSKFNELKRIGLEQLNSVENNFIHVENHCNHISNTNKDVFIDNFNNTRSSIDSNGYAQGERTSAGYAPNASPETLQPGGMLPLDLGKPVCQPVTNTPIKGTTCNGYFAPNADFMKPK